MQRLVSALLTLAGAGCLGDAIDTSSTASAIHSDAVVLQWNEIATTTLGAIAPFPGTRAMAMVQLAVYEGVNAITQRYEPYYGTVTAAPGANVDAAAIVAAHDVLVVLVPAAAATLDTQRDASLAAIPDGQAKDDGKAAGALAAATVIADRTGDGSAPPQFWTPTNSNPYEWQPTTPGCNASGGRGVFFHWQFVKPFGVESSAQFRAAPPPALDSKRYTDSFNEVVAVGGVGSPNRPQDRADVAVFYAAQPPHRGWNLVARQLAAASHDDISRTVRTFALMNMSLSDAHITVFETKYFYRTWRPQTGIPRSAEDGNPNTTATVYAGGSSQSFVVTPCFPSYPSAHGIGGGAARTVLEHAYGRKHHDITMTDPLAPTITLHYSDLRDITDDVSDARVYGGIHWRYDQDVGNKQGERVARYNLHTLLGRIDDDDDDDD